MALSPSLCLVTGATGFVGSAVARALLQARHQVRVLARPGGNRRNLADLPVEIAIGAMEDGASLTRAIADCRYLYHVAADYRLWVRDPAVMFRTNVDGTRDLMTAALAAGVERIVYTSSVATLGLVAGGSADEETPSRLEDMIGPYKRSKFRGRRGRPSADRRARPARNHRQSVDAGRPARPQADADWAPDRRGRPGPPARLCRYRAQHRACRRRRRRPSRRGRERADRRTLHPRRREYGTGRDPGRGRHLGRQAPAAVSKSRTRRRTRLPLAPS